MPLHVRGTRRRRRRAHRGGRVELPRGRRRRLRCAVVRRVEHHGARAEPRRQRDALRDPHAARGLCRRRDGMAHPQRPGLRHRRGAALPLLHTGPRGAHTRWRPGPRRHDRCHLGGGARRLRQPRQHAVPLRQPTCRARAEARRPEHRVRCARRVRPARLDWHHVHRGGHAPAAAAAHGGAGR